MISTTTCTYSNKTCGFGNCTLPTHAWHWGNSQCVTNELATSSEPDFTVIVSTPDNTSTTTNQYNNVATIGVLVFIMFAFAIVVGSLVKKVT